MTRVVSVLLCVCVCVSVCVCVCVCLPAAGMSQRIKVNIDHQLYNTEAPYLLSSITVLHSNGFVVKTLTQMHILNK